MFDIFNQHPLQLLRSCLSPLLRVANNKRRSSIVSRPGWFPCKAIWHVSGKGDAGTIEQRVCDIIRYCEKYGYKSVAIPAISAGRYSV